MSAIILLEGNDKRKAIRQVVTRSENLAKGVRDTARLLRAVSRRERIETTGIGHGVAIAHGKILGLDTVHVGLGVSREGIDYQAVDGKPVRLLFVIASSPCLQASYLQTLCHLLGIVRNPSYRTVLDDFRNVDFPAFRGKLEKDFAWLT